MVRRAAGLDDDSFDLLHLVRVEQKLRVERDAPVPEPVLDAVLDDLRLLVNLLAHEVRVPALGQSLRLQVDCDGLALDAPPLHVGESQRVTGHDRDVAILHRNHPPGDADQSLRVGRDHELVFALADDQRAADSHRHHPVRFVGRYHDECERTHEFGRGLADRDDEVLLVVGLDQVDDGLGVGFRHEPVPLGNQPLAQFPVVLDDAVVHQGNPVAAVGEWVGVLVRYRAVRGPARVPDPKVARHRVRGKHLLQPLQPARGLPDCQPAVNRGNPARIVAPIFEPLEPDQNDVG